MGRLSKGFFNKYQQSGTLKKKRKKNIGNFETNVLEY